MIRAVSHDAHSCGVSASAAWTIAALPMIGGLLVAATYPSWSLFIWILREDHLVEWAQFCLCLATVLIAVPAAQRYARDRQWFLAATIAALGLGTFGLAGEEISWGSASSACPPPRG